MLAVELLERIVGEDDRPGPLGDAQHEGVAAPDGAGRWGHDLAVEHRFAQRLAFGLVDTVLERRIDHDGDAAVGIFLRVRGHGFVELLQARKRSSFGGQVGPVHHDMVGFSQWHAATDRPAPTDAVRHFRWRDWPIRSD